MTQDSAAIERLNGAATETDLSVMPDPCSYSDFPIRVLGGRGALLARFAKENDAAIYIMGYAAGRKAS